MFNWKRFKMQSSGKYSILYDDIIANINTRQANRSVDKKNIQSNIHGFFLANSSLIWTKSAQYFRITICIIFGCLDIACYETKFRMALNRSIPVITKAIRRTIGNEELAD